MAVTSGKSTVLNSEIPMFLRWPPIDEWGNRTRSSDIFLYHKSFPKTQEWMRFCLGRSNFKLKSLPHQLLIELFPMFPLRKNNDLRIPICFWKFIHARLLDWDDLFAIVVVWFCLKPWKQLNRWQQLFGKVKTIKYYEKLGLLKTSKVSPSFHNSVILESE